MTFAEITRARLLSEGEYKYFKAARLPLHGLKWKQFCFLFSFPRPSLKWYSCSPWFSRKKPFCSVFYPRRWAFDKENMCIDFQYVNDNDIEISKSRSWLQFASGFWRLSTLLSKHRKQQKEEMQNKWEEKKPFSIFHSQSEDWLQREKIHALKVMNERMNKKCFIFLFVQNIFLLENSFLVFCFFVFFSPFFFPFF